MNQDVATSRRRRFPSKGFLAVLALTALCVWEVIRPRVGSEPGQQVAARTELGDLKVSLGAYEVDTGGFPTSQQGLGALVHPPPGVTNWHGPYRRAVYKDPWEHDYIYVYPGIHNRSGFDLSSMGPDGKAGDADDIRNWGEGR